MKRISLFVFILFLMAVCSAYAVPSEFALHWDDNPLNAGKTLTTKVFWRSDPAVDRTDDNSYEWPDTSATSINLGELMTATGLTSVDGLYFSLKTIDRLTGDCATVLCQSRGYTNEVRFVHPPLPEPHGNVRTVVITTTTTVTVGP